MNNDQEVKSYRVKIAQEYEFVVDAENEERAGYYAVDKFKGGHTFVEPTIINVEEE